MCLLQLVRAFDGGTVVIFVDLTCCCEVVCDSIAGGNVSGRRF